MGFSLPNWAEICPVQRFGVESLVPFCSLCCPFLWGGGDSPSAGSHQTLSLLHLHIHTICHCHLHACRHRAILEKPEEEASPAPDAWISLLYPVTLSNAPVWSLLLAVWRVALPCTGFVSSNTTGSAQRLTSAWPKQHLIIVNLSRH